MSKTTARRPELKFIKNLKTQKKDIAKAVHWLIEQHDKCSELIDKKAWTQDDARYYNFLLKDLSEVYDLKHMRWTHGYNVSDKERQLRLNKFMADYLEDFEL